MCKKEKEIMESIYNEYCPFNKYLNMDLCQTLWFARKEKHLSDIHKYMVEQDMGAFSLIMRSLELESEMKKKEPRLGYYKQYKYTSIACNSNYYKIFSI